MQDDDYSPPSLAPPLYPRTRTCVRLLEQQQAIQYAACPRACPRRKRRVPRATHNFAHAHICKYALTYAVLPCLACYHTWHAIVNECRGAAFPTGVRLSFRSLELGHVVASPPPCSFAPSPDNNMREAISIHLGQAGSQVGNACWELYCLVSLVSGPWISLR